MAGNVNFFEQVIEDYGNKIHDMDGDDIRLALVTTTTTPTNSDADPHFGGTGSTNFATTEVTPGGNYSAGGIALASKSWSTSKFDGADIIIVKNASNPTDARWGILYNNTDANKRCILFVDLGGVRDLTTGTLNIVWNANGIAILTSN